MDLNLYVPTDAENQELDARKKKWDSEQDFLNQIIADAKATHDRNYLALQKGSMSEVRFNEIEAASKAQIAAQELVVKSARDSYNDWNDFLQSKNEELINATAQQTISENNVTTAQLALQAAGLTAQNKTAILNWFKDNWIFVLLFIGMVYGSIWGYRKFIKKKQ